MVARVETESHQSGLTLSASEEVVTRITRSLAHGECERVAPSSDRAHGDFWSKVIKTDCCWIWGRAIFDGTGYGMAWVDGRIKKAHRVAYELEVGPIPAGLDLMHHCDVRRCVRPSHLSPATRKENQRDMVRKNRHSPQDGEHNGHAKFTWDDIRAIRALASRGVLHRDIAAMFGTSRAYISTVVTGRTWANDPQEQGEVAA